MLIQNPQLMIKNKTKFGVVFFIILLSILILIMKFLGFMDRTTNTYHEPLSWNEIYLNLPKYAIWLFIATLGVVQIGKEAEKIEKKNLDAARKRIEEREREEKKLEAENKDNDKTQISNNG